MSTTTTDPREVIAKAVTDYVTDDAYGDGQDFKAADAILAALTASGLSILPAATGDVGNRVQGMVRSMDQWRDFKPEAVAEGSDAQVFYFIRDAKTDMNALWRFAIDTLARAEAAEAENARLRTPAGETEAVAWGYVIDGKLHALSPTKTANCPHPPFTTPPPVDEAKVSVPKLALAWLMGEGPDHNGNWFGEGERGPGAFWWRSKFRAMSALSPAPAVDEKRETEDGLAKVRAQLTLLHSLANDITEANYADKRLYLLQTCVRMSDALSTLEPQP